MILCVKDLYIYIYMKIEQYLFEYGADIKY